VSDNEGTKYEFSDLNGVLELFSYRGWINSIHIWFFLKVFIIMLKNITYKFAKYEIPIILLKDFVKLGQKGEIVMMKPKKARLHFIKKSIGV